MSMKTYQSPSLESLTLDFTAQVKSEADSITEQLRDDLILMTMQIATPHRSPALHSDSHSVDSNVHPGTIDRTNS